MSKLTNKKIPVATGPVCTWRFCLTSVDTWGQMLVDCQAATTSIDFEQFIFAQDEIGRRFCEVFAAKARQGVKVRILCDTVGSYGLSGSALVKDLEAAGVEIRFFTPLNPFKFNFPAWMYRDHKKITVIDGLVGYIGGVGIQDSFEGWRDTHVRICGDAIIKDMEEDFERMWRIAGSDKFVPFRRRRYFRGSFKLVHHAPQGKQKFLYEELLRSIRLARSYVYLTTPYFIPTLKLLLALKRAARRRVDVRLLLPSVSDMTWVNTASRFYVTQLLRAGIRIFFYKNKMIHTKAWVIDDRWCSVGSFNLDNLSFHYNYESNLVSVDQHFVADLKNHFVDDQAESTEITLSEWLQRPWHHKLLEYLTVPFHWIM